jgi:hypothetical protein
MSSSHGGVIVTVLTFSVVDHEFVHGGVIVTVLTFSVVDHEFKPRSGQAKEINTGICFFFC